MLNELLLKLTDFKDKTLLIINALDNEDYNILNDLFNQRQLIIDQIFQLSYDLEQFKVYCEKLEIPGLENKLGQTMNERHNYFKSELKKLHSKKAVNMNYNLSSTVDSIFFNKKI